MSPPLTQRLAGSRRFHSLAMRIPGLRRLVRSEGEAMFDLVAGFCHSQILRAMVGFDLPAHLSQPASAADLARRLDIPQDRLTVLLNAACAIGLLRRARSGSYRLTARGTALAAVPGLPGMIAHHDILYRDLSDPVAFFRGTTRPDLAGFWPYVFGAGAATDPAAAARYSSLMADSQILVAEDTLAAIDLSGVRYLMDVGGGSGAFLAALAAANPKPDLTLFDLPAVAPAAAARFAALGLPPPQIVSGSFRDDPLPSGADAITLIRVLYDHADATVLHLLRSVHAALPHRGRLIVSEPMTGDARPQRAGDAYFALYCMAMGTGQARSPSQISALLETAGFAAVRRHASRRPFITTVIEAVRLD